MTVINPTVILRNWEPGIWTICLTVAVPIFSKLKRALFMVGLNDSLAFLISQDPFALT